MIYMLLRYPGGKRKAVTFSYDDGVMQDIRLAELFAKYGLKATFNFNNATCRSADFSKEQVQKNFLSRGHEIAVHGVNINLLSFTECEVGSESGKSGLILLSVSELLIDFSNC